MMKSKARIFFAVFLGAITARFGFDLAGWSYNPYHETFVFWKALVEYGTPAVAALIWLTIFEMVFKLRSK